MGCGPGATREVVCGGEPALYFSGALGLTTCCYNPGGSLIGASVFNDIEDECFINRGIGPYAELGQGCCAAWADLNCEDAGVPPPNDLDMGP